MSLPTEPSESIEERAAEVLRLARFALDRCTGSIIAFGTINHITTRDYVRGLDVIKMIDAVLRDLPPEPPMTPEREAEIADLLGRALRSFE